MTARRFRRLALGIALLLPPVVALAPPAHAAPATPAPCSNGYVSLSFDDSPTALTPSLLSALKSAKLLATFFDVGTRAQQFPKYVSAQAAAGDWVGNHSYSHPDLVALGEPGAAKELSDAQAVLTPLAGAAPTLFRPPYGSTSAQVALDAASQHMTEVIWTVDTDDWAATATAAGIAKSVLSVQPGGFVLMHDGYSATVKAIPQIAAGLASRGLCAGKIVYSATPTVSWSGGPAFNATVAAPSSTASTSPPPPRTGPAPISTLADTFDGTLLNGSRWDGATIGVVSQAGGHAVVPCTSAYPALGTTTGYDLTQSAAFAQLTLPPVGNGSREVFFQLQGPPGNTLQWARSGAAFWPRYSTAGVWVDGPPVAYDAVSDAWWRIRQATTTVAWDTSADGRTWTTAWSVPLPFAVTNVSANFVCGYWGLEAAADLWVDNVDVAPPAG